MTTERYIAVRATASANSLRVNPIAGVKLLSGLETHKQMVCPGRLEAQVVTGTTSDRHHNYYQGIAHLH